MTLAELIEAVSELTPDERYELANRALAAAEETPEPHREDVAAAWRSEFRRRIDDIEQGRVRLVDHEETVRVARERIARRRTAREA
jgi:hypothetical protein